MRPRGVIGGLGGKLDFVEEMVHIKPGSTAYPAAGRIAVLREGTTRPRVHPDPVDVYGHLAPGSNCSEVNNLDDDDAPSLWLVSSAG